MADRGLVIFDCDGVLVDSEPIAIAALCEVLRSAGVPVGEAYAYGRFVGRSWASVVEAVAADFGRAVGEAEAAAFWAVLAARFRRDLAPVPGVAAVLEALDRPVCVASSSRPERIALSLEATGLGGRFGPHVYSAAMVARGKPAPDLFLHAARSMGVEPARCAVVEDSPSGIEAARAAGMTVFAFAGGSHVGPAGLEPAIRAAGPDAVFRDMADLPGLLAGWDRRRVA